MEALLADREEQLTADRQSRAETMVTLERMERSVATLSEAFRDTGDRLSALMVEVESVREAQRRAALLAADPGRPTAPRRRTVRRPGAGSSGAGRTFAGRRLR